MSLFDDTKRKSSLKIGYGNLSKAKQTIKSIKKLKPGRQRSIVYKMYNRAKYHKNQTQDMRKAMKYYKKWLSNHK